MRRNFPATWAAMVACSVLLGGCIMPDVLVPTADIPMTTAAIEPTDVQLVAGPDRQPIAPGQTVAMAAQPVWGFSAMSRPIPGGVAEPAIMPAEEVQCRQRLKRLGVQFRDIAPIHDSPSCGIDFPVEVTSLARGIKLTPAAKLNCAMAEEAALWAQRDLAPAARTRYLSGIAEVKQMSSYSCRKIAGSRSMSEHSRGNALDIGAIRLRNGRVIDVRKPGLFAFRERSFLRKARGEACDRFGTVLGPGYNRDHADHFHLDLKQRRNVACH